MTTPTATNPSSVDSGDPVTVGSETAVETTGGSGSGTGVGTPTTGSVTATGSTTADSGTGAIDETSTGGTSTGEGTTMDPLKFDMAAQADLPPPPVCVKCALTIASQQSGVLAIEGQHVFATAQLQGQVVYALGTYGSGRFIATADSTLPFNEQTNCPLSEWLAATGGAQPKILYFGWGPMDGPKSWNVPSDEAGIHLPAKYIGNPAALQQDYDIVMYLEGSGQFGNDAPTDQEMTTLLDYIAQGGGMYVSSEFYGYLNDADLVSVNRLLQPLGVMTQPVSLNWGNVDGNIEFECFPEPQ